MSTANVARLDNARYVLRAPLAFHSPQDHAAHSEVPMNFFVNMHDGLANHYMVDQSEFAAEGVNWPVTMARLAARHCPDGPIGYRLEINSHGLPAEIRLQPHVRFGNLGQFAVAVQRLLKPGSAIEILACKVAAFPTGANSPPSKPLLSGSEIRLLALQAISTKREKLLNPHTGKYTYLNGPLFCSRLANRTGCTVRAGLQSQAEEFEQSRNAWFFTPIGNWEGHVLDFAPSGDVRYAGFNVPRPVFRIHDQFGDGPIRAS